MDELGLDPAKKRLLYFSRGRGSGHAIPDMEIVKRLPDLRSDVELVFVSYASGAETLADHGYRVIDLGLPEIASLLDVIVLAGKVIGAVRPHLVVAHEEFGVLPAARVFDRHTVFLADWFIDEDRMIMSTLRFASEIFLLDRPGRYPEPSQARGKTTYMGPILRELQYSTADRSRARSELGLDPDAAIVTVLPGRYATEARVPVADLVIEAFDRLDADRKQLAWLAGADAEALRRRWADRDDVVVLESDWRPDRLMVAGNVAVTKANRGSVMELEALGIPSVALSPCTNPIDDARTRISPGVRFRELRETSPESLARDLRDALRQGDLTPVAPPDPPPARRVAEAIAQALA